MRVVWLSGGASSFVAAMLSKPDKVVYIDVANQHPDTLRFILDCQDKLGQRVEILRDVKHSASVDVCIDKYHYLNGVGGAPCTLHLKKRVREEWERTLSEPPTYIWGYDSTEENRAKRLDENSEFENEFPLIEHGLTKENVHALLMDTGIKRPAMYELGYSNNNCIGCVKGGKGYWNKIRKDFPAVFNRRAKQERAIGASCIKGRFLDELKEGEGNMATEIMPQCSFDCVGLLEGEDK